MGYAQGTTVPVEQTKMEIERMLRKYGADQFGSAWNESKAMITFRMHKKYVRVETPIPKLDSKEKRLNSDAKVAAETRRRYRAVLLYLKAMLEAVESQIVSFEVAFMSHVVLPNQQTAGQHWAPQIESAYKDGKMPPQLPGW